MGTPSPHQSDPVARTLHNMSLLLRPLRELWFGIRSNSVPWAACGAVGLFTALLIAFRWDVFAAQRAGLWFLYPRHAVIYAVYSAVAVTLGFWFWAAYRAALFNQFERKLNLALVTSGLRNRLGKTPRIIADFALDENTRKLKITSANFPKKDFETAKPSLETGLRVYIEEIKEDRSKGIFDIIYSKYPMPSSAEWEGVDGFRGINSALAAHAQESCAVIYATRLTYWSQVKQAAVNQRFCVSSSQRFISVTIRWISF